MRRYETIFVLRPDLGENQIRQTVKRIENIVGNGGELIETDEWGMRELAYHIKRERRGFYVRLDYVAPAAVMNEVERNLKLMDEALRYLSVMVEEEADTAHLRGEVEARKRRLAEARAAASGSAAPAPAATAPSPETGTETGATTQPEPSAQDVSAQPQAAPEAEQAAASSEPPSEPGSGPESEEPKDDAE